MNLIEDDSIPIPNNDKEIIIFSPHFPKHNWSTDPLKPHRNLNPSHHSEALAASKQAAQHGGLEARESSELKDLRRRQGSQRKIHCFWWVTGWPFFWLSKDELFEEDNLKMCQEKGCDIEKWWNHPEVKKWSIRIIIAPKEWEENGAWKMTAICSWPPLLGNSVGVPDGYWTWNGLCYSWSWMRHRGGVGYL